MAGVGVDMGLELVHREGMKCEQKYNRWNPVPKELEREVIAYYLAGNSACKCDEKFGVSTGKVLQRNGIKPRSKKAYDARNKDKEAAIIALYQSGKSVANVMKEIGCGEKAVDNCLARNGIKKRTGKEYKPKSLGKEQEIIAMYISGVSSKDTGVVFGVCETTVLYVLKVNGVSVRRAGAYKKLNPLSKDKSRMRSKLNAYRNARKKVDPLYKLTQSLRARMASFFRRGKLGKSGIVRKQKTTIEMLGADFDTVFNHINSQMKSGMTWENYGQRGWHIDHRTPLCSAKNQEELMGLMHYTNLQPLWALDNQKKGGKNAS